MGYSTTFNGVLTFKKELTIKEFCKLQTFMGQDCRNHPEWDSGDLTWIDLEIYNNNGVPYGLCWNGSEKTYDLVEKINFIIQEMRKDFPDFGLEGEMSAVGEDEDDRWRLVINESGFAESRGWVVLPEEDAVITCPYCGEQINISNNK